MIIIKEEIQTKVGIHKTARADGVVITEEVHTGVVIKEEVQTGVGIHTGSVRLQGQTVW